MTPPTEATDETDDTEPTRSLEDPNHLEERDAVPYRERERVIPDETFEALRERYDVIAGVTQVGITDDDGAVLLAGSDTYAPLGGNVAPDEDWIAAAERAMTDVLGHEVRVDDPIMFERTIFKRERDDETVDADSVLFTASLVDPDPAFWEDPQFPAALDHPMYGDDDVELAWVDDVDDVDENHVGHVEAFLG